ncbi:ATP-binding protein [Kitasatospora sp. NPDC090308]|uniref:ATP-binding protein n=1 Tax=Kitasatospora sp. NPDC090308 TaxID=3364082 RepID=UPI0037F72E5B
MWVPLVRSAAQARAAVSRLLRNAGTVTGVEVDAHLVATELVTNANRHAGGVTGFSARLEGAGPHAGTAPHPPAPAVGPATGAGRSARGLCISVEDDDVRLPRADTGALEDMVRWGGRGWALVLKLCAAVDVCLLPGGGKRISAVIAF